MNNYAILMETDEDEVESWYYFIKNKDNEKALDFLETQLNKVDMKFEDGLNIFILDKLNLVSETTVNEMCRVNLNHICFHKKFNDKLQLINFYLKKKDSNYTMLEKINKKLKNQSIKNYIINENTLKNSEEKDENEEEDYEAEEAYEIISDNLDTCSSEEESDGDHLLVSIP